MKDPFAPQDYKITVIGGGTGSFTILSALKDHTSQLAAIVNMVDDGGSTGVLRDEMGALPPGDVRQCLVALSESSEIRKLFDYRFPDGTFAGHSFGNIFLSVLEKTTGNFAEAIEAASEILRVNGVVIPATFDDIRLKMSWPNGRLTLRGERKIDEMYFKKDPRKAILTVEPNAKANPTAIAAIEQADMVVIAPGDLYTSLGPLLVIDGIGDALRRTDAKIIYVCNLVTKVGQTEEFSVADHANEIERFGGGDFLDAVLYNSQKPSSRLLGLYKKEGGELVKERIKQLHRQKYQAIGGNFLGNVAAYNPSSNVLPVKRSLIRHNSQYIALALMDILEKDS